MASCCRRCAIWRSSCGRSIRTRSNPSSSAGWVTPNALPVCDVNLRMPLSLTAIIGPPEYMQMDVTMAIPATVLKVLDDWHINYQLTDDQELFQLMQSNPPASYSAKVANVVFLKDTIGQVQVVIPGNRLLDLNQLAHQLGRQFTALSGVELEKLKRQHGLTAFPALPQVTGIESLIDSHLLEQEELFIVSGGGEEWLKLPMEQFRTLITRSRIGDYTATLHTDIHYQDAHQDLDDVHA